MMSESVGLALGKEGSVRVCARRFIFTGKGCRISNRLIRESGKECELSD